MIRFYDDRLLRYLGARWDALAQCVERAALEQPLCRDELETAAELLAMLARNENHEYAETDGEEDVSLTVTMENRLLAEAVIRHAGAADAQKRLRAAKSAKEGIDLYAVWYLAYLADRCKTLAAAGARAGLGRYRDDLTPPPRAVDGDDLARIERRGIDPRWLRAWKKDMTWFIDLLATSTDIEELARYAQTGESKFKQGVWTGRGPPRVWELDLDSQLIICTNAWGGEVEIKVLEGAVYHAKLWLPVFAAGYYRDITKFRWEIRLPLHWPDQPLRQEISYQGLFITALGYIIGCRQEALRLARILIIGQRRNMFQDPDYFPAAQCVLRILADYLGEPAPERQGEALTQPVYNALAAHWRTPDAALLAPVLLAACDEHTWRSHRGKDFGWTQEMFDFALFRRTPVEILLVLKLRNELGLPNPALDHPLMNTPLGTLPEEVAFDPGELIGAVVARMRADGFDDDAILADFVSGVPKI